jgi:hypothetical protein
LIVHPVNGVVSLDPLRRNVGVILAGPCRNTVLSCTRGINRAYSYWLNPYRYRCARIKGLRDIKEHRVEALVKMYFFQEDRILSTVHFGSFKCLVKNHCGRKRSSSVVYFIFQYPSIIVGKSCKDNDSVSCSSALSRISLNFATEVEDMSG